MGKLKLGAITDDRPVKMTVELPAQLHRDLVAYAQALARETGQGSIEPAKLISPMLMRFIATDRAFAKLRRQPVPQERPRERTASRTNATNLPTAASSISGGQASTV